MAYRHKTKHHVCTHTAFVSNLVSVWVWEYFVWLVDFQKESFTTSASWPESFTCNCMLTFIRMNCRFRMVKRLPTELYFVLYIDSYPTDRIPCFFIGNWTYLNTKHFLMIELWHVIQVLVKVLKLQVLMIFKTSPIHPWYIANFSIRSMYIYMHTSFFSLFS